MVDRRFRRRRRSPNVAAVGWSNIGVVLLGLVVGFVAYRSVGTAMATTCPGPWEHREEWELTPSSATDEFDEAAEDEFSAWVEQAPLVLQADEFLKLRSLENAILVPMEEKR
jgi:hypothetical protein